MRMLPPPSSQCIREDRGDRTHGLTLAAAAKVLGVARSTLSTSYNGRSDLSGNMVLRIEKAFGVKVDTLMRTQASKRHRPPRRHPSPPNAPR